MTQPADPDQNSGAETPSARSLRTIAAEIRADWQPVYYAAKPYVEAMGELDKITDNFYEDSARDIVTRFLTNAQTWRGETARLVKAELKAMLKAQPPR